MNLLSYIFLEKDCPDNYNQYFQRVMEESNHSIDYFLSSNPKWSIVDGVTKKISNNGNLLPFFGDTIVYTLNEDQIAPIAKFQKKIRKELGFLAEPLKPEKFHITIHDLSNGPVLDDLKLVMIQNQEKCKLFFKKIYYFLKENPNEDKIRMRSTSIFPIGNTSIVLGFAPEKENDYKKLFNLYSGLDKIQFLEYWPRFHVTLDYFKPIELNIENMNKMGKILKKIYQKVDIEVDINNIAYQHFFNMNDYKDIFRVTGKIIQKK